MSRDNGVFLSGCLSLAGLVLVMGIVAPLLYAAGGYFVGWILANVFTFAGDWVTLGANRLGIEIALQDLPVIGAFLGFVGAFFKAHQSNTNNK